VYLSIDSLVSRGSLDIVRALTDAALVLESLSPAGAKARKVKALQDKAAAAVAARQGKQISKWVFWGVGGGGGARVVWAAPVGAAAGRRARLVARAARAEPLSPLPRAARPPRRRLPDVRARDTRFSFSTPPELAAINVPLPHFGLPDLPGPDQPLAKEQVVKTVGASCQGRGASAANRRLVTSFKDPAHRRPFD
jgi:hypothetical protein